MAIEFVSSSSANANTLTMPTHQAGDVLAMVAFRFGNATPPTVPSGWFSRSDFGANNQSISWGFRVAQSASETSGTWTNASALACLVFRLSAGEVVFPIHQASATNAGSTTHTSNYTTFITSHQTGSWYLYAAMTAATDSSVDTAPSGFTTRESRVIAATGEWIVADTNSDPGSRPNLSTNVGGTSAAWTTHRAKLIYFASWPSGSGGLPLGRLISGGV